MTFPKPFTVKHQPYTGLELDQLNNEIPCWDDPVEVKVIQWVPTVEQRLIENTSRQVVEARLLAPPDLAVNLRDRFILPAPPGKPWAGGTYEVIEAIDLSHGFHGWHPGNRYTLRKTPATLQYEAPDEPHQL